MVMGVKRQYDSSSRQEQAQRNQKAVLDAAERRFLADGFGATTIAAVASDAGVSVETIYKRFGNKASLVAAIHERGLAGPVSYTHLRAHETVLDLVCRLLLAKKKKK